MRQQAWHACYLSMQIDQPAVAWRSICAKAREGCSQVTALRRQRASLPEQRATAAQAWASLQAWLLVSLLVWQPVLLGALQLVLLQV